MDALVRNAWLVPFLPLLGALVAAIAGKWLKGWSHLPVVAGIGLAFFVSLGLLFAVGKSDAEPVPFTWLTISDLRIPIKFQADGLSTMMLAMVTFVATLVAVYSSSYMAGDPAYPRFFALVGLFVFSMTGLVLSANYLLTYVFWEGVGVCSYLLVGFWHAKPEAASAAKKAFLVNRIGDVGFAIAIFWMYVTSPIDLKAPYLVEKLKHLSESDQQFFLDHLSRLDYSHFLSSHNLDHLGLLFPAALIGIPLLLFWAATAKSAQFPLYVWLPDAMEGPTPVSALIHAATMVTAGVYLIARSSPLLIAVPGVQVTVSIVGCITALLAASIAVTQTDLKRVMAYSTVSQLGYMFMALGAGVKGVGEFAIIAGMFHLFTHAFFKALLFLSSGSVMHSMGGVIDMREFGGLRKRLPITHWCFVCGALALCGIPIFAGFWSKDEILTSLLRAAKASNASGGSDWGWIYFAIYGLAVLTAMLTAFYTGRAYFMTFWGPEKLPSLPKADAHHGSDESDHSHGGGHDSHFGHESPPEMTNPLIILAVCSVLVGLVFGPFGLFEHHLAQTPELKALEAVHAEGHGATEAVKHSTDWATMAVGTLVGLIGLAFSYLFYGRTSPWPARLATRLRPLYNASLHKFYVDEIYNGLIVRPTRFLGSTADFLDKYLVSRLVVFIAWVPQFVGKTVLGPRQNGLVQYYAAGTALGVALLLLFLLFRIY
jgi:NADH-quinone oxidoreductase subunit L